MKYISVLFLITGLTGYSQDGWDDFTGNERAFFYHQARKVEVLNESIFHLFEFTDSIPYINDTLPDYSYVEREIAQHPSYLKLHADQINRKSDGVWADLAVRYALWELDCVLQFRNSTAAEDLPLKERLKVFEKYVLEKAPQSAVRTLNNGDYVLATTVQGYYAPSLTVSDKLAAIVNAGYSQIDQMLILNAIMEAQEKYIAVRAVEIFTALGGQPTEWVNEISAVGDGANWAEIKGGYNTPWTIGLPDEKGLFRFNIESVLDKEKDRTNLVVQDVVKSQFVTDGDKETVVHVDVFGYHPERQTTIAVQKGGNSYVLYGKNDSRLVSPDSTYGEGTTYWRLMYSLEHFYIANLKEDLYGKRGYEYQIDLYEKKIEVTKLQIKKTEYRLDKLRYTPEGKPKIKKKKIKKKDLGRSDQDGQGHAVSALSKLDKKRNIEQNRLVQLNGQLLGQKAILQKLKEDMEKAYINLVKYETKLDYMRKNIGYLIMEYEQEGDVYTFKDGATFNYSTQDFVFPENRSEEVFQVYHISFGEKVFDEKIDENFAHIHVSKRLRTDKYALRRVNKDSDSESLSVSDSIQIREVFEYLTKKEHKAVLTLTAGGIAGLNADGYFRDSTMGTQPFDAANLPNNGVVIYDGAISTQMNLGVTVYDDAMIPNDFEVYRPAFEKLRATYPNLNEVDFYTGIRAKKEAEDWLALLKVLATKWLNDAADRRAVLAKLNKIKVKEVYFKGGNFSAKVPELAR